MYAYALLLSELNRYDQSLQLHLQVREMAPMRPRVNYNLAMLYEFMGEALKAEHHLKTEIAVVDDLNSRLALLKFYLDRQDDQKALSLAKEILESYPKAEQVKELIPQIEQKVNPAD